MNRFKYILFSFLCITCIHLDAQNSEVKNAVSVKVLLNDYTSPLNGEYGKFRSYLPGFEVGYHRNITSFLNIAVPFRAGVLKYGSNKETSPWAALDVQGNLKWNKPDNIFQPYVVAGLSGVYHKHFYENDLYKKQSGFDLQIPLGLGIDIRMARYSYLNAQVDYRIGLKEERSNVQIALGFKHLLGKIEKDTAKVVDMTQPDRDGDGVPDLQDKCPDIAGYIAFEGCPDTDQDGIPDPDDECPTIAGPKASNGCPDKDGDGIADYKDQCPDKPGLPEFGGCPDSDGDGIPDHLDDCPNQFGLAEFKGCPDRDSDGVPDKLDKCPDVPGPKTNQGCPELKKEEKKVLEVAMKAVQFDLNKATLRKESYPVLDQIVSLMKKYPYYRIAISGHTDNTGNAVSNQKLSEQRAKTCYQYLIDKGISASRVSYAGFGPSQPLYDNKTSEGRKLNRRVEFDMIVE